MPRFVVLLIGIVAFAAAGVGTYVAFAEGEHGLGPVPCGDSDVLETHCIPGIPGDAVVAALQERGFECDVGRFCELTVGDTWYRAEVVSHEDVDSLIARFVLDVRHNPEADLGSRATAFLDWFVAMPFGEDPEADEVGREWLAENLGSNDEATIRGFEFSLASPEPGHIRLSFDGIGDVEPPTTDGAAGGPA